VHLKNLQIKISAFFFSPFVDLEQLKNWITFLITTMALLYQQSYLLLMLFGLVNKVPYLKALSIVMYHNRGRIAWTLVLLCTLMYVFAFLTFTAFP